VVRSWFSRSHSGLHELGALAVLYGFYEVVRGVPSENVEAAMRHTSEIVALEQSVGVYVEHGVQEAFEALPVLPTVLGLAYVLLHFAGTATALVWLHRRHREHFPLVRTTLVAATAIALVGYVLYPAAPPRLADLGFSDTVTTHAGLNLSSDLLGALYNPFAAVPSLHFGYALIVGVALATLASRRWVRVTGALYPVAMLLVIVATGNHFVFDAALGGIVVVAGWLVARLLVEEPAGHGTPSRRRHDECPEPCAS
jgi:PAP2 superfamily protein